MAASSSDYFKKASNGSTRPVPTTLTAIHSGGGTTMTCNSLTGWPTDTGVAFCIYTTDTSGNKVAGSQTDWTGTVSGSTITNCVLKAGTDSGYSIGAIVEASPIAAWADGIATGALVEHNQNGTHSAITATSITATTGNFTTVNVSGTATSQGWTPLGSTPATVTANGNRNYDLVFNGVDLTSTLSPGMKLQLTRTVAAPSQCTDLEASSSQSWSKASATGFSTGTTWTWAAKIKVESYGAGVIGALDDGTNRLQLFLDSSGRINISGGLVAGDDVVTSYASVPLNKWVDVTASITIGTPTGEIRLDDTVIASFVTASASTTMTIGTPTLYAGRNNAGNYFDGKIAQLAVFNAVISDATLKTYSSQTKTGSETSCKGLWKFNGDGNDSSSSANNLTANNGAAATNADSPFANAVAAGTLEYAEINSVVFSTNTTVNVRVPDTCQIPTTGGISAVSYSTQSNPYGLPAFSNILGYAIVNSTNTITTPTTTTQLPGLITSVVVPTGRKVKVVGYTNVLSNSGANANNLAICLGSASDANRLEQSNQNPSTGGTLGSAVYLDIINIPATSSVTYVLGVSAAGGNVSQNATTITPSFIRVELV